MTDDIPELNLSRGRDSEEREADGDDAVFSFAGDDADSGSVTGTAPNDSPAPAPTEPGAVDEVLPEDVSETDDDEVEPVELLVQLAREGTIDPWDIDIVEVTDAFLNRLDAMDLRTTGRALFYASVLLRMKSDELLAPDDPDEEELEPWELALQGGGPGSTPSTRWKTRWTAGSNASRLAGRRRRWTSSCANSGRSNAGRGGSAAASTTPPSRLAASPAGRRRSTTTRPARCAARANPPKTT